jgi:alginate O-acetyltransferase complex protein AlgI
MLFNSLTFLIFFVIVYMIYLFLNHKHQNRLLLVASYIFYGWWDYKFLSLIFISTVIDYFVGIKIYSLKSTKKRVFYRSVSLFANLAILGFFKYFGWFIAETGHIAQLFGVSVDSMHLNIVLPVGISFYTFQTMSYSWDIYRNELKPVKNFFDFALFVSFFPQLVAGPIERAKNLIPQIIKPRKITLKGFHEGCYLIFFGLFKKIAIADTLAVHVNSVFNNWQYGVNTWVDVFLGGIFFGVQIYCDFSAYSDIARGLSKMMGFDLMLNFNLPFFAKNPSDFWRRWHISLSTWFRDYLYIPLGGSQINTLRTYINIFIVFTLSGLWHGASMSFVIWGIYHAIALMLHKAYVDILKSINVYDKIKTIRIYQLVSWFITGLIVAYGWLIFRANSLGQLIEMSQTLFMGVGDIGKEIIYPNMLIETAWLLLVVQLFQYFKNDLMVVYNTKYYPIRSLVYLIMIYIMLGVNNNAQEFIYFQF